MSLIDEALKRARLDAARQDAARQAGGAGAGGPRGGFASPWTHMEQSRGRRSDPRRIAAAAVVALSLLVGAAGIVLFVKSSFRSETAIAARRPPDRSAAPVLAAPRSAPGGPGEATAAATVPAPAAPAVLGERTTPERASAVAAPGDRESGRERESVGTQRRKAAAAASSPAPPVPANGAEDAAETPPAPSPPGAAAGTGAAAAAAPSHAGAVVRTMADGGSYVGEVKLADGGSVKLSGIVWSDVSPVAVINGKLVGPAQAVDQVTVDKIEPGRVTLRHQSGALFYLRLN
jgi:hypothetical protein